MKIGILSDAHGNSLALQICLDHLINDYKADKLFFLGDAVGYYPNYKEVLELLQVNNVVCLSGNHEAMLLGHLALDTKKDEVYRINKNKVQLNESHFSFLKGLLPYHVLTLEERILFVHGNPYDPLNGYTYPTTDMSSFDHLPFDLIFMGHTHYPFIKKIGNKKLINVGSCGLPRDEGSLLSFVTYNTSDQKIELLRKYIEPEDVIAFYGKNNLHESTINCLFRKSEKEIVGRII